jgi:hypothetical protein
VSIANAKKEQIMRICSFETVKKVLNLDLSFCWLIADCFPLPCHCEAAFAAVARNQGMIAPGNHYDF